MGEQYLSMCRDVTQAIRSMTEAMQSVDRVHRALFAGQDRWQDDMMDLADKAQRELRHARRQAERLQLQVRNRIESEEKQADSHLRGAGDGPERRIGPATASV